MKKIFILIAALWLGLTGEAQTSCERLTIEIMPGRSSRVDASRPMNFYAHFRVIGVAAGITTQQLQWFVSRDPDASGSIITGNANGAYYFGSRGYQEWGRMYVRLQYRCPYNNRLMTSNILTIEVLDYGIHFMGNSSGSSYRFRRGVLNPFFDPAKPTVLYVHGWNKGSVAAHRRETLLDNNQQYMIKAWRDSGYNVGIFYWNQFSDEDDVKNAEDKIYDDDQGKSWKREGPLLLGEAGDLSFGAPDSSIKQLFLAQYYELRLATLEGGSDLRVAGHSLGAQLSAYALAEATPASYRPNRLALLDPFWNISRQTGLRNALVSLRDQDVPIEWYTSSCVQTLASTLNNLNPASRSRRWWQSVFNPVSNIIQLVQYGEMVATSAYTAISPRYANISPFDPVGTLTNEHNAAVWWYFTSLRAPQPDISRFPSFQDILDNNSDLKDDFNRIPLFLTSAKGPSAASCSNDILRMRGDRYLHVKGTTTLLADDDIYLDEGRMQSARATEAVPLPFAPGADNAGASGPAPPADSTPGRKDPDHLTTSFVPGAGEVSLEQAGRAVGSPVSYRAIISCNTNNPKVTSWHLSREWRGDFARTNSFRISQAACSQPVKPTDYSCTSFDKGHIVASGDRNGNLEELRDTYFMHNMVPMNPSQNQTGIWYQFEQYLAQTVVGKSGSGKGLEVFVIAGALKEAGKSGVNGKGEAVNNIGGTTVIEVPSTLWKVALIHKPGQPFTRKYTVMAGMLTDNSPVENGNWGDFIVPVDQVEALTGYNFFDKLSDGLEDSLEAERFDIYSYLQLNRELQPGEDEERSACESLTLSNGFSAAAGSRFRGYIDPSQCAPARIQRQQKTEIVAAQSSFRIAPNPTTGSVTVSFRYATPGQPVRAILSVTDMTGRRFVSQAQQLNPGINTMELNLSQLATGIYLVQLRTEKGEIYHTKLSKQ